MNLAPGKGHDFHKHPDQEEVIYVVAGEVEQWVDREKRMLGAGRLAPSSRPTWCTRRSMSAKTDAKIVAILGPCVGPIGYELVDVAGEAPWKDLRKK